MKQIELDNKKSRKSGINSTMVFQIEKPVSLKRLTEKIPSTFLLNSKQIIF